MPVRDSLLIRNKRKDFLYERAFGAVSYAQPQPLGRLAKVLASPLAQHPIFQSSIPSCFPCAASFTNQYNSWFKSNNDVALSWPFLFAQIPHFSGGSVPQDSLDILRSVGQPEDKQLPQAKFWDQPFWAENENILTSETYIGAEGFKISNYFFFKKPTLQSIFAALTEDPIIIGVKVDPGEWAENTVIPPASSGFAHAVVLLDVDAQGNMLVCSWDKRDKLDIRILHPETKLLMACVIRDLPDGLTKKDVQRGFWFQNFFKKLLSR